MTDEMILGLLAGGKLTVRQLRIHLTQKNESIQRLRQQRDSANALISLLTEEGDADVHEDRN